MKRRTTAPAAPVNVKPQLDRREREACSAFFFATCSGEAKRPKPGTVDPLWLRLGMRASNKRARAGWAVSSPILDASLRRSPENDPSLPGPGWLREVYVYRDRDLVTLPGTLARIEARRAARVDAEPPKQRQQAAAPALAAPAVAQLDLFGVAA